MTIARLPKSTQHAGPNSGSRSRTRWDLDLENPAKVFIPLEKIKLMLWLEHLEQDGRRLCGTIRCIRLLWVPSLATWLCLAVGSIPLVKDANYSILNGVKWGRCPYDIKVSIFSVQSVLVVLEDTSETADSYKWNIIQEYQAEPHWIPYYLIDTLNLYELIHILPQSCRRCAFFLFAAVSCFLANRSFAKGRWKYLTSSRLTKNLSFPPLFLRNEGTAMIAESSITSPLRLVRLFVEIPLNRLICNEQWKKQRMYVPYT